MRPRLSWKLFLSSLILIGVVCGVVAWLAARDVAEEARQETRDVLHSRAALLEFLALEALGPRPPVDLEEQVRRLGSTSGIRITIIDDTGVVVADSAEDPANMENHADRPEVRQARERGTGEATRFSHTVEREMIYVAQRVDDPGGARGTLRVSLPLRDLHRRLAGLRSNVFRAVAIAVVVALLLALFFARRFTAPLRSMTEAASAIASGDFDRRVRATGRDEIGELAEAFDSMAKQLRDRVAEIQHDREELRAILAGMVEGVVAVDREERIVLMNATAERMLGLSAEKALGNPIWEVVRIPGVEEALRGALAGQRTQSAELRRALGGRERVLSLQAAPMQSGGAGWGGVVLVLHDISELRRLESVRRDFVANASHELKTPLSSVRGLVETILEDEGMEAETRRGFLQRVLAQVERLGALVEEMLALSRLESEQPTAAEQVVDLPGAVREAVEGLEGAARERHIEVVPDYGEGSVGVRGRREALRRVAENLLSNAIRYSPRGTRVDVRVVRDGDSAVVEVVDRGPGIPLEKQERIFERFFRVDEGRAREVGGTGLGLAIVKHLVQAMRGSVSLESAPGTGSTFRARFPVA